MTYCKTGWPEKPRLFGELKLFHSVASELSVENGLLLRGNRLVIPAALRKDILNRLHEGHQGIVKCRERARQAVWWPLLSKQLEEIVQNCPECCKSRSQRAEPLKPTTLPSRPCQKVGTDLFEWKKLVYLLIVDYCSRWIEVAKFEQTTAECAITHSKSIFCPPWNCTLGQWTPIYL